MGRLLLVLSRRQVHVAFGVGSRDPVRVFLRAEEVVVVFRELFDDAVSDVDQSRQRQHQGHACPNGVHQAEARVVPCPGGGSAGGGGGAIQVFGVVGKDLTVRMHGRTDGRGDGKEGNKGELEGTDGAKEGWGDKTGELEGTDGKKGGWEGLKNG